MHEYGALKPVEVILRRRGERGRITERMIQRDYIYSTNK
jgi:hypothetical protein